MQTISYADKFSLPNVPAVYIIRTKKDVLYIGSSARLKHRVCNHNHKLKFKDAISIDYIICSPEELGLIEREQIRNLKPILNIELYKWNRKKLGRRAQTESTDYTTLRDKTLNLLNIKQETTQLKDIAIELNLSKQWLSSFAQGDIPDPSVNKIQKLYQYLTNSPLKV